MNQNKETGFYLSFTRNPYVVEDHSTSSPEKLLAGIKSPAAAGAMAAAFTSFPTP
jgi:hypothetical protein